MSNIVYLNGFAPSINGQAKPVQMDLFNPGSNCANMIAFLNIDLFD